MAATREFEAFIRAWKRRLDMIRWKRALLAREARREAAAVGKMLGDRFGVDAVYLVGSALDDERFDESSDLDIAVKGLSPERYWEAVAAIEEMTRFPFDLIDMETAGRPMVERAEREGMILYGRRGEKAGDPWRGTGCGRTGDSEHSG